MFECMVCGNIYLGFGYSVQRDSVLSCDAEYLSGKLVSWLTRHESEHQIIDMCGQCLYELIPITVRADAVAA